FYAAMNRESLTANDILDLTAGMEDRSIAAELAAFLVRTYLEEGNPTKARLFLEELRKIAGEERAGFIYEAELRILYHEKKLNELFVRFLENSNVRPADSLLYAALYEKREKRPEAK